MTAQIIPFPVRDSASLWDVFIAAFYEWERLPSLENSRRKERAFLEWAGVYVGNKPNAVKGAY